MDLKRQNIAWIRLCLLGKNSKSGISHKNAGCQKVLKNISCAYGQHTRGKFNIFSRDIFQYILTAMLESLNPLQNELEHHK